MAASLIDVDDIVPQTAGIWYHQKRSEAEKAELRIEKLKFEKRNMKKKAENKKAKRNKIRTVLFLLCFQFLE